jgi:hypothetical protein
MNTNLFHARLDAQFLIPLLWQGRSCIYRPDEPVDFEELIYGCMDGEADWRRVERLGAVYLYWQVARSDIPLVLFEWPGPAEPIRGSLYLTTFGLRKTFVLMHSRSGPNLVVAAYRGMGGDAILPLCVASLLSHGDEWFGHELFDEMPARTINRRPDLLPRQTLLGGYCDWAAQVLGETERALTEAHFEATYEETPLAAPVPKAG